MKLKHHLIVLLLSFLVLPNPAFPDDTPVGSEDRKSSESEAVDASEAVSDVAASESAEPRYLLRYQFQPGDQLRYSATQKLTQTGVAKAGRDVDFSEIQQQRLFTVEDVSDDGMAKVAMQFEHVRMEWQSGDDTPEVFDSTMAENEVPRRFKESARNLKKAAPKYTVHPEGSPVNKDGEEVFPEGGQATFMIPLPAEAVPVGHSWKTNIVVKVRLDIKVNREITLLRTYRLKSVVDDIATIGFATSVATTVKSPTVKAQLLQATPQGEIQFDLKHGRLVKKVIRIDNLALGVLGPNSMLSAVGSTVETLVEDDAAVTSR
ncbi:MAG: DUF6263 family protein [Planctomycetaceae bacterium]